MDMVIRAGNSIEIIPDTGSLFLLYPVAQLLPPVLLGSVTSACLEEIDVKRPSIKKGGTCSLLRSY